MNEKTKDYAKSRREARTLARLGAVQALYQMEHSGQGVDATVREFLNHRLGSELDGVAIREADDEFFVDLTRGVVEAQRPIDRLIDRNLREGWSLKRIDSTARAILRCGAFEMIRRPDVPAKVVIDEYVEIANDFFGEGEQEPKFINGLLEACGREARAEEFA
ncbi:transcription antitermination factor NusB [Parvularcula lutaonensis]|uniref:Transcription antitermination protein NusB n=1 Tax=Parvularcula lutaonensis TaxID=491923 RepID=A0ABV7MED3_9PROT|nr:transcription antitermination factor NusB [Parvularcula lutaonensis]GGY39448.1 N utilization substance protein B [Parvularcula lutaonensis]